MKYIEPVCLFGTVVTCLLSVTAMILSSRHDEYSAGNPLLAGIGLQIVVVFVVIILCALVAISILKRNIAMLVWVMGVGLYFAIVVRMAALAASNDLLAIPSSLLGALVVNWTLSNAAFLIIVFGSLLMSVRGLK